MQNLFGWDNQFLLPGATGIQRHELDKPHFHALLAGELRQRHDLPLGNAFDRHGVQSDLLKPDALGRVDAGVVVTKYGHVQGPIPGVACYEAGHPVPDENSCLIRVDETQTVTATFELGPLP